MRRWSASSPLRGSQGNRSKSLLRMPSQRSPSPSTRPSIRMREVMHLRDKPATRRLKRSVSLTPESIEYLESMGSGNLSLGIEKLVGLKAHTFRRQMMVGMVVAGREREIVADTTTGRILE